MKYHSAINTIAVEIEGIAGDAQHACDDSDPRLVIRGESTTPQHSDRLNNKISLIDYLAFTLRVDSDIELPFPLKSELIEIFNIPFLGWKRRNSGWNGYAHKVDLDCYGLVAFGGKSQQNTVHVRLGGQGCAMVKDWTLVHDWLVTTSPKLKRLDIAHDDFEGQTVNISKAIEWEKLELYKSGGRSPNTFLRDDRESGKGKTFEIGNRENGKFGRIYEKGKQLGNPTHPWCRAEVEFKSCDREIPYEAILNSDEYLSGAYPAFEFLCTNQSRIKTSNQERLITLERATEWCRTACGQYLNLFCLLQNENLDSVIHTLRRPGIPKNLEPNFKRVLIEAGIIL
jgi:phage replication initiation protein